MGAYSRGRSFDNPVSRLGAYSRGALNRSIMALVAFYIAARLILVGIRMSLKVFASL